MMSVIVVAPIGQGRHRANLIRKSGARLLCCSISHLRLM
jgi:hypothetical protein